MTFFFGSINVAMFDWPWSIIHLMSGTLIGLLLAVSFRLARRQTFWWTGIGLLAVWELYEWLMHYLDVHHHAVIAAYKTAVDSFAFAPETWVNITGDLIIGSVGLGFGRWIVRRIIREKPRA
ncbi:MAG: hypothetical protein HY975_04250 [Candidatus Kerfeldbacteria bacterium]|nr:hypothetical protein [Candidatus Kerfeldbacteria bacterium]